MSVTIRRVEFCKKYIKQEDDVLKCGETSSLTRPTTESIGCVISYANDPPPLIHPYNQMSHHHPIYCTVIRTRLGSHLHSTAGMMGEGAPDGGVAISSYLLITNWWIEVGIVC